MTNWIQPALYHSLTITATDGTQTVERVYGNGASTYYYQLKGACPSCWVAMYVCLCASMSECVCVRMVTAFADAVQHGTPYPTDGEDGVRNMAVIDAVYKKAGLPVRGTPP